MNEVEKMYRNSGIEKHKKTMLDIETGNNVLTLDSFYPEFTAEKQLELIKWLGSNKNGFGFFNDDTEGLSCHCDFHWEWFKEGFYAEDFDNALAGLINNLWQDLTEEDKTCIKNILEM